jgi:hypothetical protein
MKPAERRQTFRRSQLFPAAWALLALASVTLASCGGSGSTGRAPPAAPTQGKTEKGVSEQDAVELAKKEFVKSGSGLNATDCRVTGVKAAKVQHESVWIVTIKHQGVPVPGGPIDVIVNKRTGEAHFAPKR